MNEEEYYVFDFDGTIAKLEVDWEGLREVIRKHYYSEQTKISLSQKFVQLKKNNVDFYGELKMFELHEGKPKYKPDMKVVNFLKKNKFSIISNNLQETIKKILVWEKIGNNCEAIISIDTCENIKPNSYPLEALYNNRPELKNKKIIYVGDSERDEEFSINNNLIFVHVNDFKLDFIS